MKDHLILKKGYGSSLALSFHLIKKETPKQYKVVASFEKHSYRSVVSKEWDYYVITDEETAKRILYFYKKIKSDYEKAKNVYIKEIAALLKPRKV